MSGPLVQREPIAEGLHACFSFDPAGERHLQCEWDPAKPRSLTPGAWRAYRDARARFMQRVADAIGQRVVVVDPAPAGVLAVSAFVPSGKDGAA